MNQNYYFLNLIIMKKKNPIEEARRYVQNAHDVLSEKTKLNVETGTYEDPKYVRAAGNYLWLGTLMALDAVFHVRKDRRTRVHIDDYLEAISKRDKKLLDWVDNGYMVMHLYMTYDGVKDKKVCAQGFCLAEQIINRCATLLPKT